MPPPVYHVPDVSVMVMAYVKAIGSGRQYHPRRFEVLVPAQHGYNDLRESWSVLHGDKWLLHGKLIRADDLPQA